MTGLGVVKNGPDLNWTPDRVSLLKAKWSEGMSASEIAREIGREAGFEVSRSAVIGKAHRLNLSGRTRNSHLERRASAPKTTAPKTTNQSSKDLARRIVVARAAIRAPIAGKPKVEAKAAVDATDDDNGLEVLPLPDDSADRLIPAAQRKSLFELTAQSCRWPIGDPRHADFFFCGGVASSDGGPYCNGHARRA